MGKRFTDTELWDKEWFMNLEAHEKLAFQYLKDKCSCIGVLAPNARLMAFIIGERINLNDLAKKTQGNIEFLENGKIFLPNFCFFQYGELKETCKPHKKYIELLKLEGLFERVTKGYTKGIDTQQEKEEEKEKEKEKEKALKNQKEKPQNIDEVKAYCQEKEWFDFDPETYFKVRNANDWVKANGKKVKCWKRDLSSSRASGTFLKKQNFQNSNARTITPAPPMGKALDLESLKGMDYKALEDPTRTGSW